MEIVVRELKSEDEASFMELWKAAGDDQSWCSFCFKEGMVFSDMLEILRKEKFGIDLRPDRVPHTMLYGFLDNRIVGRVSIRHALNDHLRHRGGNIGYWVLKSFRGNGYGSEMARQGLTYCKSLGLNEVMITCADDNQASWKVIERQGGLLKDKIWDDEDKEIIRRYWIQY